MATPRFYIKNNQYLTWSSVANFFVKSTSSGWAQITDAWVKTSTSTWSKFYSAKYAPDTTVELLQTTAADGYTIKLQGKQKHWTPNPVSLKYYFKYADSNGGSYYIGSGGSSGASALNASVGSYITYPSSSTYITIDPKGSNYSVGGTATYYFEVRGFSSNGTSYPAISQEVVQISTPSAPNVTVSAYDTNSITISVSSSTYNNWLLTNRYIVYTYDIVGGFITSGGGRGGFGPEATYGSNKSITLTGLTKGRNYIIYVAPFTGNSGSTTTTATGYAGAEGSVSQTTVNGYFVTYSANGGINPPTDSTSYNYGDLVNTKAQGSMTYGTKAFTGWNTAADGTGTPYTGGSSAFYIYAPVTLYAQWLDFVYPPNPVGSLAFSSNSSSITWTFTPSSVDSSHSAPSGYAYTYNTTGTTPSNGNGTFIDTTTWASTGYNFAIQLLSPGSTYYGFIQPRNVYNGTTQYGSWTSTKAMTTPPAPTYTYYYGLQNVAGGAINIYGHSSATSLSYTVYRTGTGTGTSGYGTGAYTVYDTGTFTKTEGTTFFGSYYPAINGYYYIIAYQTNIGGDGSTSTSQRSPQNWFWGPPPAPSGGTVSISTNTGNYNVGSVITYSTSGWSPTPSSYNLELHNGTNPVLTSDPLRASTTSSSGTYTITSSDVGNYFKAFATATGSGGTSSQVSSAQVGPAISVSAPTISGSYISPSSGTAGSNTFYAYAGTVTGSPTPTLSYQWQYYSSSSYSYQSVSGATNSYYSPPSNFNTLYPNYGFYCAITATNSQGSAVDRPSAGLNNPVSIPSGGSVTLSGNTTAGSVITASTSGWSDSPTSYDVYITTTTSGTPTSSSSRVSSSGGTSSTTYTITSSDAAPPVNIFRAFATASNSAGTSSTVQSSNVITTTQSGGGGGGGGGGTAPSAPSISGNNSLPIGGTFSWSSSGATGYAFSVYGPSGLQYSTYGSYVSTTSFRPGYDATWQGAGTYSIYVYANNAYGSSTASSLSTYMS